MFKKEVIYNYNNITLMILNMIWILFYDKYYLLLILFFINIIYH